MKVGIAYPAFVESFKHYFPELEIINNRYDRIETYDLIIFSGGEDISPSLYTSRNIYSSFNEERDQIEREIFESAFRYSGSKFLGVCRGHQLINVLLGGTLIQDLYHEYKIIHEHNHKIETKENSIIGNYFKDVNSLHHQAIGNLSRNLRATSFYKNIIESCENERIITTQFHPEFMRDKQSDEFFDFIYQWVSGETKIKKINKSVLEKEAQEINLTRMKENYSVDLGWATSSTGRFFYSQLNDEISDEENLENENER